MLAYGAVGLVARSILSYNYEGFMCVVFFWNSL